MDNNLYIGAKQTVGTVQIQSPSESYRAQAQLSTLSTGQTLQGKVISVSTAVDGTKAAQINIGNNIVVSARLQGNMALNAGQNISFEVRSTTSGTVTLSPLYENTAADSSMMKALNAAGLAANDTTLEMVKDMMESGMSVDRNSLLQMNHSIMEYPSADIDSLIQMAKLNIPITEENITQFQNYQNYEHQVINSVSTIMNELPEAFQEMIQNGNQSGAMDLYGDLMNLFSAKGTAIQNNNVVTGTFQAQTGNNVILNNMPAGSLNENTETALNQTASEGKVSGTIAEVPAQADTSGENLNVMTARSKVQGLPFSIETVQENAVSETSTSDTNAPITETIRSTAQGQNLQTQQQAAGSFADNVLSLFKVLNVSDLAIKDLIGQNNPAEILQNDPAQTLKLLADIYLQTAHTSEAADHSWTSFFSSSNFTGMLQKTISEQWLIAPADVESRKNVENLYQRLHDQTAELTRILSDTVGAQSKVSQSVNNLSGNLEFMNQLNQMFAYVQLPLKMQGQNAHGDLYVYTNQKNLASKDGQVSAILHLDMEHLGPLDVYVKMKDQNVSTNFYLADDAALDLIASNIAILDARLQKRGYTMHVRMMLQNAYEPTENAALDELLQKGEKITLISDNSFDARA